MQTDCIGKALVRKLDNVLNIYLSETTGFVFLQNMLFKINLREILLAIKTN